MDGDDKWRQMVSPELHSFIEQHFPQNFIKATPPINGTTSKLAYENLVKTEPCWTIRITPKVSKFSFHAPRKKP